MGESVGSLAVVQTSFVCEMHEEYRELGLRPVDMPEADPRNAVAHDILEHFPGDDGGVEAEFMALGAAYWLRGETGYFQRNGNTHSPEAHIAADFRELYQHVAHEGFSLEDPSGATGRMLDYEEADEALVRACCIGLREVNDEDEYDADDEALADFTSQESADRIVGWLRLGYLKAVERYAGVDAYTLAHSVFRAIDERAAKWLQGDAVEGQTLRVTVDLKRMSVTMEAGSASAN